MARSAEQFCFVICLVHPFAMNGVKRMQVEDRSDLGITDNAIDLGAAPTLTNLGHTPRPILNSPLTVQKPSPKSTSLSAKSSSCSPS